MSSYEFSIIIPFEFHRGLSEKCVQGWIDQDAINREDYQIIIAAPEDHDPEEIDSVQRLLAPHDKLLRYPHHHDMPLLAEAVNQAEGDNYFFTEAHCLPAPDCLAQSSIYLEKHPDVAGFSGRSIPVTHNLLSEIEAEMYSKDIEAHLSSDNWLKALDQCLVIRRDAYEASGAIQPEYGHFAEWILAARFHQKDLILSYCPDVSIQHYYCGDLNELIEFTIDFANGKIRFMAQGDLDAATTLFPEIRTLNRYRPSLGKDDLKLTNKLKRVSFKLAFLKLKTQIALSLNRKSWAHKCFIQCIGRSVAKGYLIGLKQLHAARLDSKA